jgi:hypothetical protein
MELKQWLDKLNKLTQQLHNLTLIELSGDTLNDTNLSMVRLIESKVHRTFSKLNTTLKN